MCNFHVHSVYNTTLALGSISVGLLFQALAIFTFAWSIGHGGQTSKKLKQECYVDQCFELADDRRSKLHSACVATAYTGLVLGSVTFFLACGHTVKSVLYFSFGKREHDIFSWLALAGGISTCVVVMVSLVLWGVGEHDSKGYDIGYGMVLSLVAGLIILVGSLAAHNASDIQYLPSNRARDQGL